MPYLTRDEFLREQVIAVKELCDKYGCGEVMCLASALWRRELVEHYKIPPSGAFVPQIYFNIKKKAWEQQQGEIQSFDRIVEEALK